MPGAIVAAPSSHRYSIPDAHQRQCPHTATNDITIVVARHETGYPITDLNDCSRAFVAADHGKHRYQAVLAGDLIRDRHVALEDVVIRVAQSRCSHLDEHLPGARRIELEILDR